MENKKILISSTHKNRLAAEFNTSKTSVQHSIDFVFNSDQAKAIRKRAKEMLLHEASKIEI